MPNYQKKKKHEINNEEYNNRSEVNILKLWKGYSNKTQASWTINLNNGPFGNKNILRLHVTMNNTVGMQVMQCSNLQYQKHDKILYLQ